jgi:hypothetical protein
LSTISAYNAFNQPKQALPVKVVPRQAVGKLTAPPPPVLIPEKENVLLNVVVSGLISSAIGALVGDILFQGREGSVANKKSRYAQAFRTLVPEGLSFNQQRKLHTDKGFIKVFNQLTDEANASGKSFQYNEELLDKLAPWLEQFDPSLPKDLAAEFGFVTTVKSTLPEAIQDILMFNKNSVDFLDGTTVKNTIDSSSQHECTGFIAMCFDALVKEAKTEEEDLLDALYKVKRRRNVDQFGSDYAFPTPKVKNSSLQWLIEDVSKLSLTNETQKKQVVAAAEKSKAWFSGIAVVGTVLGSVGLHFMTKYHNKKVAESELQRLQLAQEPLVDALDRLDKTFETRKAKNESEARKAREKRLFSHQHQQEKPDKVLGKTMVERPQQRETVQAFWEKMREKYRI